MDRTELDQLPALLDVPTAAGVLGIGRTLAYDLVKTDRWPTPVLRIGRLIRIPTAPLVRLIEGDRADTLMSRLEDGTTGVALSR